MALEGQLAQPGAEELQGLAERTRDSVDDAIPSEFTPEKFVLQHTYKTRTKMSALAFAQKFFSSPDEVTYIENPKKNDPILRFYDQCPRYEQDVKLNPGTAYEYDKFMQSPLMRSAIDSVSKRIGMRLTAAEVVVAYSACAFDVALFDDTKQWCSAFDAFSLNVAEYADDLETFYEEGGAFSINYEMSAVLLRDIMDTIKGAIEGTSPIVGHFRFVHAETTLPLMTLLGYVDKTPLKANWPLSLIESRAFRSSKSAPFMANIEFRLYRKKIPSSLRQRIAPQYFVQVSVNEVPLPIPMCDGTMFCPLAKYEQIWAYYLNKYDFNTSCEV